MIRAVAHTFVDYSQITGNRKSASRLPTIHLESMSKARQGRFMPSARSVFRHNGQYEGSKLGGGVIHSWSPSHDQRGMLRPFGNRRRSGGCGPSSSSSPTRNSRAVLVAETLSFSATPTSVRARSSRQSHGGSFHRVPRCLLWILTTAVSSP